MSRHYPIELDPELVTDYQLIGTIPVTYTWENIEIGIEIKQGNPFSSRRRHIIRKCILNNGKDLSFYIKRVRSLYKLY